MGCVGVQVEDKIVSQIGPGLLCLIGLKDGDTAGDAEFMWVPSQTSNTPGP